MRRTVAPTAPVLSRRQFLRGSAGACLAGAALPALQPRFAFGAAGTGDADVLVFVLLRGGMDGLSAVVPAGDSGYYGGRKTVAVPGSATVGLDGNFGFHPALAPLGDIYRAGDLAVIPACGSFDPSRSHFDQQDIMERGADASGAVRSGWLGRHLASRPAPAANSVPSVGTAVGVPLVLESAPGAESIPRLSNFGLAGVDPSRLAVTQATLTRLAGDGPLAEVASETIGTIATLVAAQPASIKPANGAKYPSSSLATQLQQTAQLIRAGVGLQAAAVDMVGWDTHADMGTYLAGQMRTLLERLAGALSAFYVDLLDERDRVTTVVLSEFGRRVAQNGSGGTDHGHGGAAFVMGGGVRSGVYGTWPGLAPDSLDQGDVPVTTDFRSVLAEVLQQRAGNRALGEVFPGFTPTFLGFTDPR